MYVCVFSGEESPAANIPGSGQLAPNGSAIRSSQMMGYRTVPTVPVQLRYSVMCCTSVTTYQREVMTFLPVGPVSNWSLT